MSILTRYPLKERMRYLSSLQFPKLLELKRKSKYFAGECIVPSDERTENIKNKMLQFMPKQSLSFLTKAFKFTYPYLPIFTFPGYTQSPKVLKLQVAISSILIGDFINQLTFVKSKIFKKYVPDKYLLLSADFFHIKGSVYGSSLSSQHISYYMSCIEGQMSKLRLNSMQEQVYQTEQFCDLIEWKSSPFTYGYGSLYALVTQQKRQQGLIYGYNLGLLQNLKKLNLKPSIFDRFTSNSELDLKMEAGRASMIIECMITELTRKLEEQPNKKNYF